ncbi:4Fe-4S dicluster domain-containing protein [Myxococcota bacterium]|nr:4Fe-4S dicluster domain-containing protein [Myxococcota bacterium]
MTTPAPGAVKPKKGHELRPVESAPSFGDLTDDPIAALRRLAVFRGLTEREITTIASSSSVVRFPQDLVIPRGGEGSEPEVYYFVLKGQVAFAEFTKGTVPKGPHNPKKRVTPTMQVAKKMVALFDVDDFFTNAHVAEARGSDGNKNDMALFTALPVVLLKLPKAKMDEALGSVPKIKEAIEIIAEESYYRQTLLKLDDRAEIFDFYVREGYEYAKAIKIIQSDKCIDCDECVKACEDRHGVARIERFGPRLGLVQFTLNCRTCQDARCINVCNFDAIGYDHNDPAHAGEVIVYDNCVGCTLCSKACPHESIRMVDIKDETEGIDLVELAKQAKAGEGAKAPSPGDRPGTQIAKGEEKAAAKKKAKRIANKCDHCFGYADMACISACPTGAIIQIDPRALFRRDGGLIERADKYFETAPFELGWSQTTKTQGVRAMHAIFVLSTIGVLACVWEFFARRLDPSLSVWRAIIGAVQGAEAASKLVLTYAAVSGMGRWMGYVGSAMMTLSALYTLRLHVPGLRKIGSSKTWFDFHVVFGLAGPVLVLLHTNLNVFQLLSRPLVTGLWWCVPAVVLSGLVGRFLYTAIPKLEHHTEKEKKRLDEGIKAVADQWASMTQHANVLHQFLKAQEKTQDKRENEAEGKGLLGFLWFLLQSEVGRISAELALRTKTMGKMRNAKLRNMTIKLMSRRSVIERRMQFYGVAKRLLALWRHIHIAISILMFVLLAIHVAISIYAMGL